MKMLIALTAVCGLMAAASMSFASGPPAGKGPPEGKGPAQGLPQNYIAAPLSGLNEVPEVESEGGGVCLIRMRKDVLTYKLIVEDLDDVTQAHLHLGKKGENGPVIAFLFGFVEGGVASDGILAEGVLEDDTIIERPALDFDGTRAALIREMRAGNVYVNVHTVAFPGGEIRGQVRSLGPQGGSGDGDDCVCECTNGEENAQGSASALLGDLNADGVVDERDLQILMDRFTSRQPEAAPESPGDEPTPKRGRRPLR